MRLLFLVLLLGLPAAAQSTPPTETDVSKATQSAAKAGASLLDAAEAPPPPERWVGTANVDFTALAGNSSASTLTALVSVQRSWNRWLLGVELAGAYGRARPAGEEGPSQVIAERASVRLRGDRRFTERVSAYLLGLGETDHVKSVEGRLGGEGGVGMLWLDARERERPDDEKGFIRLRLRTDLGLRYFHEWRFQYYPARTDVADVDFLAPRAGVALRYGLTPTVYFVEEFEVLPNVLGQFRFLLNSTSRLVVQLTESLGLSTSLLLNHDSAPPPGRRPTDLALVVGLQVII